MKVTHSLLVLAQVLFAGKLHPYLPEFLHLLATGMHPARLTHCCMRTGGIITSIFNFILIAVLGTHDEAADVSEDAYGGRKNRADAAAGTGPATSQAAQAV